MKMTLVTATAMAAVLAITGSSLADKASRQEHKAERQEKKAERQEKKAERQERKADRKAENGEHKGMGKFDKNHDGVMSDNERIAKHDDRPGWSYRKDLPGMGIDVSKVTFAKVSPSAVASLNVAGGSGSMGGGKGEHNGASSNH